jgi:hypothetical protein
MSFGPCRVLQDFDYFNGVPRNEPFQLLIQLQILDYFNGVLRNEPFQLLIRSPGYYWKLENRRQCTSKTEISEMIRNSDINDHHNAQIHRGMIINRVI